MRAHWGGCDERGNCVTFKISIQWVVQLLLLFATHLSWVSDFLVVNRLKYWVHGGMMNSGWYRGLKDNAFRDTHDLFYDSGFSLSRRSLERKTHVHGMLCLSEPQLVD